MALDLSAPFTPLPYGLVKKNGSIVDALTGAVESLPDRTERAIAFLRLSLPDATEEDFDALSPAEIHAASLALYRATFFSPSATV